MTMSPRGLQRLANLGKAKATAVTLAAFLACAVSAQAQEFGFEQVREKARQLAQTPFDGSDTMLPDPSLTHLDYNQFREIEYRREKGLWHGQNLGFEAQFFHRGGLHTNHVRMNVVKDGQTQPIPFDPANFNYRALQVDPEQVKDLGYAGFRLLHPVNVPDRMDEVIHFVGASYFRALGKGNVWGLSQRGLAINTTKWGHEEFPWFREFWLVEPTSPDHMRFYGLLDSQSTTGAYQFDLKPGDPTVIEVQATLFIREGKTIETLGIAPQTSMYLFGEIDPATALADFRPEVHDSDGLQVQFDTGEWLWRPLHNPDKEPVVSKFHGQIKGFGLQQRDRDFDHYQDLEAVYQKRPGLWIEPLSGFGQGTVTLVELPAVSEAIDSIVSFWTPDGAISGGQEITLAYRVHVGAEPVARPSGWVTDSRLSLGPNGSKRFTLEFAGPAVENLPPDAKVEAMVNADGGLVGAPVVHKNEFTNTWRVFFDVTPAPTGETPETQLRAFLKMGDHVLSETWSFKCAL